MKEKVVERITSILPFVVVLVLIGVVRAHAGTGGAEFTDIYTTLEGWATGSLGKVISIGAFLVGIAAGIVRQSIMAVVTGIGTALAVNYSPTVIDSIVQALI